MSSCSDLKKGDPAAASGNYSIDPDGEGDLEPFSVYCDMTDKTSVGVTVISHDSENRSLVIGYEPSRNYWRDIHYTGASLSQLASLTSVSSHCEQFIKYECYHSMLFREGGYAWWVSRDSTKMTYWGGASPGSGKCACGMNNSCADPSYGCNCDANDNVWREDSGLLTGKFQVLWYCTLTCLSHSHTPVDFIIMNVLIIQQKLEKKTFKLLVHLTIYKQLQLRFNSINYACKGNSIKNW